MKIVVASKNPVKINAAREGFKKMFPEVDFEVEGISVPSMSVINREVIRKHLLVP